MVVVVVVAVNAGLFPVPPLSHPEEAFVMRHIFQELTIFKRRMEGKLVQFEGSSGRAVEEANALEKQSRDLHRWDLQRWDLLYCLCQSLFSYFVPQKSGHALNPKP